ncbi:MAG TPA: penicillin-binding transpeptidase domain-containing protein [Anaerolineae bacterium]
MLKRLLVFVLVLTACSGPALTPTPSAVLTPTLEPPPPEQTALAYFDAWARADYTNMYQLLTPSAQAAISENTFASRYNQANTAATVNFVRASLKSALRSGERVTVDYHLEWDTILFGTLMADHSLTLVLDPIRNQWGVDWNDGLIWPALAGGNLLSVQYSIPRRANIYDADGKGLAVEDKIVTVGVVPDQIVDEPALIAALSPITGLDAETIAVQIANAQPDWYVPLANIPFDVSQANRDVLALPGVQLREKAAREYRGLAAHVIGYVGFIGVEELEAWKARGYRGDEFIGKSGLEQWGESILAGTHGATLNAITPQGTVVETIAERPAAPSRSIYLTIRRDFQQQVENILGDRDGAIVVVDPNTGRIMAMASHPDFDPNELLRPTIVQSDQVTPTVTSFFDRAVQGAYPPGSTFKPVTMAAGLEVGGFTPNSAFFDPGYWDGLGVAFRKYNWKEGGDGNIDLVTGLSASNNTVFYEVGKTVELIDSFALPNMARAFGLGHTTGITGVVETPGVIPDPGWKLTNVNEVWTTGDGVNMAIGQGYVLATPLQMANLYAAIANGGTLYRPEIIARIGSQNEPPEEVWQPSVISKLPVTPENLQAIRQGLHGVIVSPKGTAGFIFRGFPQTLAGKTGTAEAGNGKDPHAWFICWSPYEDPQIVVAVFLENGGQGSYRAAPLARNVLEAYYGLPLTPPPDQPPPGPVDR